MNDYVIHTTAIPPMLMDLLTERDAPTIDVTVTFGGDCFYGWGEGRNSIDCLPHLVILASEGTDQDIAKIAQALHRSRCQVVITSGDDWSDIAHVTGAPMSYDADHSH